MSRARWLAAGVALGALVVLLVGAGLYRRSVANVGRWEAERDAALARSDSVSQVAALTAEGMVAAQAQARASEQRVAAAEARATRAGQRADALASRRDSVRAAGPVAGDSATWYRVQLADAEQEVTALRASNASLAGALAESQAQARLLYAAVDSGVQAMSALHAVNADLAARLAEANAPCRVLWFGCPSRTTAAIVGALSGGLVGRAMAQ